MYMLHTQRAYIQERDWSVQSILEFSAMKKNLKIISDMDLEGFLDCPLLDSFPHVLAFHSTCFQSG